MVDDKLDIYIVKVEEIKEESSAADKIEFMGASVNTSVLIPFCIYSVLLVLSAIIVTYKESMKLVS